MSSEADKVKRFRVRISSEYETSYAPPIGAGPEYDGWPSAEYVKEHVESELRGPYDAEFTVEVEELPNDRCVKGTFGCVIVGEHEECELESS